jgi:hypothetical protein
MGATIGGEFERIISKSKDVVPKTFRGIERRLLIRSQKLSEFLTRIDKKRDKISFLYLLKMLCYACSLWRHRKILNGFQLEAAIGFWRKFKDIASLGGCWEQFLNYRIYALEERRVRLESFKNK